jgi:hypothetical protein
VSFREASLRLCLALLRVLDEPICCLSMKVAHPHMLCSFLKVMVAQPPMLCSFLKTLSDVAEACLALYGQAISCAFLALVL